MKYLPLSFMVLTCLLASCSRGKVAPPPNIILILADDLGYGELGCYGQERIETPHIDALAASGMRFTDHYSGSAVCAPSRCILLTGKHSGHAYIRGNDEWRARGPVWDYRAMIADSSLEGQRPLPEGTMTIASRLKKRGYRTGMSGKWGLGAPHTHAIPNRMGFDFFCGYNCQRIAHTFFPVNLWLNEHRLALDNDTVAPHTALEEGKDPMDPASYADFQLKDYAPDVMFSQMEDFIRQEPDKPFFLYWASPIPHLPLQAPERLVDYYVEKFGEEAPYSGDQGYFPCRHPRATYAAMISYLDERIGELIKILKEEGAYENTLILFTSDNGPTYTGGSDAPWFNSAGPFPEGRGRTKGSLYEGGIRVPLIASWPGHIEPGRVSAHPSAFWDYLPTLCQAAGLQAQEDSDGISFLPTLTGQGKQGQHAHLYWEFPESGGQQAVRLGPWKGIRRNLRMGNPVFELYRLEEDPAEEQDVAAAHPEVVEEIERIMEAEHEVAELPIFRMNFLGDPVEK